MMTDSLWYPQVTTLKEDLPGFLFESNRGTKHSFTAETSLGPEFSAGWSGKKSKKLVSKTDQTRQKIRKMARDIYEHYFEAAQATPRGIVAELAAIVAKVEAAVKKQAALSGEWRELLSAALGDLASLLEDDTAVSAYELNSSGLIQCLLKLFGNPAVLGECTFLELKNVFCFKLNTVFYGSKYVKFHLHCPKVHV